MCNTNAAMTEEGEEEEEYTERSSTEKCQPYMSEDAGEKQRIRLPSEKTPLLMG